MHHNGQKSFHIIRDTWKLHHESSDELGAMESLKANRERESERESERDRDRQTDRQTESHGVREIEKV